MKVIIHDLAEGQERSILPQSEEFQLVSAGKEMKTCIGCFGCWLRTPGKCAIKDEHQNLGTLLSKCSELTVISQCLYGSYSPQVKSIMDRCIPYLHPNFCFKNGEMHHRRRYDNQINMRVFFYGQEITDKEKNTARHLVRANSINLHARVDKIDFLKDLREAAI